MRVIIVGSPWQAVVARSLMEYEGYQDVCYVVEYLAESTLNGIRDVLAGLNIINVFPWNDVALELLFRKYGVKALSVGASNISRLSRVFIEDCAAPTKIYVFNINSPVVRSLLKNVPRNVPIYKLEDGVVDYLPFKYTGENNWIVRFLRAGVVNMLSAHDIYDRNSALFIERIERQYSVYPERVEKVCADILDITTFKDNLRMTLSSISLSGFNLNDIKDNSALVIGQSLYEDRSMSLEQECEIYRAAILKLRSICSHVYFKPHPRSAKGKIENLKELEKSIEWFTFLESDAPVEVLLVKENFKVVVGMWSNPIIYGRKLFGVDTYSMMHDLNDKGLFSPLLKKIHSTLIEKFEYEYIGL